MIANSRVHRSSVLKPPALYRNVHTGTGLPVCHNPLTPMVIILILSPPPQWDMELGKEIEEATANERRRGYIPSSHRLTNDMPSTMAATFLLMLFHSFSPSLLLQLFHLGS